MNRMTIVITRDRLGDYISHIAEDETLEGWGSTLNEAVEDLLANVELELEKE